jgi:hypothetical protein
VTGLLRPRFAEGQILGAGDLNAHVTYDRLGAALHERTEHLWGVAAGLELAAIQQVTADGRRYVDVQLRPGRAVDRLGRVIVLTEARDLEPALFTDQIATPAAIDLYPVYVQAIDRPRAGDARPGACATVQPTLIEESLQISFDRPGSEIAILDQEAAPVSDGLGAPTLFDKVLVGWVRWSPELGRFAGVESSADGRGVRHVGVVAGEVVAPGGRLGLRTRPGGARFALTLTETPAGGCELRFGKQDGDNPVASAFSVDEEGNISYRGTLSPLPAAQVLAESGVASDGVRLPLPAGISEEQVSQGRVRIHALLTPMPALPREVLFDTGHRALAFPLVVRCLLDEDRRVRCLLRWFALGEGDINKFVDLPGACTYVLVVSGR